MNDDRRPSARMVDSLIGIDLTDPDVRRLFAKSIVGMTRTFLFVGFLFGVLLSSLLWAVFG